MTAFVLKKVFHHIFFNLVLQVTAGKSLLICRNMVNNFFFFFAVFIVSAAVLLLLLHLHLSFPPLGVNCLLSGNYIPYPVLKRHPDAILP